MPVEATKTGMRCNGVPVRVGVPIGSPLGRWASRRNNELATCLECGRDIWVSIGAAGPGEGYVCLACASEANDRQPKETRE